MIHDFPYSEDSALLFESLAQRPWAVFLDSGSHAGTQGRYDILTADPETRLVTLGVITEVSTMSGTIESTDDPFILLQDQLGPVTEGIEGIPFCGGAIGYFGYDLGHRLERLPEQAEDSGQLPEMAIGIYSWALIVDHHQHQSWLLGKDSVQIERYRKALLAGNDSADAQKTSGTEFQLLDRVSSNMSQPAYLSSFLRIKSYIREGDCYQVNLAQRFSAPAEGDAWQLYRGRRRYSR